MAILIKTDGSEQVIQPQDGKEFHINELYELVGNGCDMVQGVGLADGSTRLQQEAG